MRRFEVESKEMFVAVREKNGNLVGRVSCRGKIMEGREEETDEFVESVSLFWFKMFLHLLRRRRRN